MMPPHSISRSASFHDSTRMPGRNSATRRPAPRLRPAARSVRRPGVEQRRDQPERDNDREDEQRAASRRDAAAQARAAARESSSVLIGSRSSSGGNSHSSIRHANGIISSDAGTPRAIHRAERDVHAAPAVSAARWRRGSPPCPPAWRCRRSADRTPSAIISARPKLLSPGRSPASRSRPTPSGSSIAATAMSVIHIEMNVPTVEQAEQHAIGARADAQQHQIHQPRAEARPRERRRQHQHADEERDDRIAEPGADDGAEVGDAERGNQSRTTSSEVTANGSVSVTQSVTANAMMRGTPCRSTVSGIRLPARSSGGGVGSA